MTATLFLLALVLQQSTPSGGAIAKLVPPVPTPESFISDERRVLTPEQRRSLDQHISRLQQDGLGDIAVAIVPTIGDYAPNQLAVEIYRTWKVGSVAPIGSAHRNVGALILIAPRELTPDKRGHCWINTGTGSEGMLTDAIVAAICRDSIIPHLRKLDYAGAVEAGIGGIEARLRRDSALVNTPVHLMPADPIVAPRRSPAMAILAVFGTVALVIAGFAGRMYARHRGRRCPSCQRQMTRLSESADDAVLDAGQRMEESLRSVDYDVWVCNCGRSKAIPYPRWFSKYSKCKYCDRRTASSDYVELQAATTVSTGLAENRFQCQACGQSWTERVVLPQIVEHSSSSSSGSSGGGGGGGGGGGHSFGGSGSTAGGGGGSSY